MNAVARCIAWLTSPERRKDKRRERLPLVAHYWNGGAPVAHQVRDISARGLYLLTDHRWYPGTVLMLSLQREDLSDNDPARSITVNARVVHSGADGVGFSFVMPREPIPGTMRSSLASGTDQKSFQKFLGSLKSARGGALVEYALLLPLIFLLIVNVVNFGGFFYAWIGVANAARAAADYAILGGSSVGDVSSPTGTQIQALIAKDIAGLPNNASLSVVVCENFNGTVTSVYGTCSATGAPADPEPTGYTLSWVDVTYTYVPFVSAGFKFVKFNVYATIPPTTIHRRAVMRMIE